MANAGGFGAQLERGDGASLWEKLRTIDRRWIFLLLAIVVVIPYIVPLNTPIQPTDPTKALYNFIDERPEGSTVLISFDYGPASKAELQPMAEAIAIHCFRRGLKVIGMTNYPDGVLLITDAFETAAETAQLEVAEYEDWVNIGFKPGGMVVIKGIGTSLKSVYPADSKGKSIDEIPMLSKVRNYDDMGLVVCISSAGFPDTWVMFAHEPFDVPVGIGVTGVMAATYYTYLDSGQVVGMLGGLKGAAEYEEKVETRGEGKIGMDSQSVAHLLIIALVIIGNIAAHFSGHGRRR